ncbi:hypothetical protein [Aliiroseovarius sp.]|uniref:hypothetical protein n=1 Tax=Aliiroseovarius sp. TaxID=1872442 RepID=UPI002608627C|nr:hypothetical protein [Aliiroseovarius sp.]
MSQDKYEARLNRINASMQPKGASQGGGSGSWKNGQGATGTEPKLDDAMQKKFTEIEPTGANSWDTIRQQLARLLGR